MKSLHTSLAFVGAAPLSFGRIRLCDSLRLPFRRKFRPAAPCRGHLRHSYAAAGGVTPPGGSGRQLRMRPLEGSAQDNAAAKGNTKSRRKTSLAGLLVLFVIYMWSFVLILPMLIAHPLVLALDRQRRRFQVSVALLWMRCSLMSCMMRPTVTGRNNLPPPQEPVVFVANHSSYLDIFPLAFLGRRLRYVSKSEIFKLPVVGWAMYMMGNIGVRRMDRRGQVEAYRNMVSSLRNGASLVVYPEGTRSETGKMRKFQPGAFRAAKAAGVRVVPVTITGTRDIMPSWAFVPLRFPTSPIRLTVHPPISSEVIEVDELRDLAFAYIDSALPPEIRSLPPTKISS
jgi:1-acyl-sn-glycerol-3-phosphate acyltransferase